MEKQIDENNHIEIFTEIYESCQWGDDKNENYKGSSGSGSLLKNNENTYIPLLRAIIINNRITSVVDLGCGNWLSGKKIYDNLNISYTGYDAYEKLINYNKLQYPKYDFIHLDITTNIDKIKDAELYILKDVLQHWKNKDIYNFLDNVIKKKKCKYILICNDTADTRVISDNFDISDMKYHYQKHGILSSFRPITAYLNPLKKYNPLVLTHYVEINSELKQISLIINNK